MLSDLAARAHIQQAMRRAVNIESELWRCLAESEKAFFGPRSGSTLVSIEVADIARPRTGNPEPGRIVIQLTKAIYQSPGAFYTELAHECGHLITWSGVPASMIEEGACVVNACDALARQIFLTGEGELPGLAGRDYWQAEYLVRCLLDHDRNAIRRIREQRELSLADADLIQSIAPGVSRHLAEQLTRRWEPSV